MSTISGGSATSAYDNLSAMLEFVKSPEYLKRIKALAELEKVSQQAHDDARASIAQAETKTADLNAAIASHGENVRQFTADKAAHDKRVALWNAAMVEVQKAMRGED